MHKHPSKKSKLLIFSQWFTPGYKAGGPVRSIQNFIELMNEEIEIFVFTSDRDLGDDHPYKGMQLNKWLQRDSKYTIIYADRLHQSTTFIKKTIEFIKPDVIYLNSMYAYRFFLLPLFTLKRLKFQGKVILAPRGMLKSTAVQFKKWKKKIFISVLNLTGLLKHVYFQATDEQEARDILSLLKIERKHIHVLENVPLMGGQVQPIEKQVNSLALIFIGRIHPIKGLDFLLNLLKNLKSKINLEIVGWAENKSFYNSCREKIKLLPANITVDLKGNLPFEETMDRISENHFMILPTHGENFGHAIFESLSAGRPVIISDQTPWRKLEEKGIGWDIPLSQPERFQQTIEKAASMDQEEYNQWSKRAFDFSKKYIEESDIKEKYLKLFGET